jgi:signal peptidase I
MGRKKNEHSGPPRKIREFIESASMAILVAIGLKVFLVEAFQIPTPSMQPTLMGCKEAQVFDRILVDKACYLVRKPKRWDVVVFRYPLKRNQNYVKRLVGLPGDHLRVEGGDLYNIQEHGNKPSSWKILRKPDGIQAGLWRSLFKAADENASQAFETKEGVWTFQGEVLEGKDQGSGARTGFLPVAGLTNAYWHGYPSPIKEKIVAQFGNGGLGDHPPHYVGDLAWSLRLDLSPKTQSFWLQQRQKPSGHRMLRFRFGIHRTKNGLRAEISRAEASGSRVILGSEKKQGIDLPQATTLEIRFEHRDGLLEAWVGSQKVGALSTVPPRPAPLESLFLEIGFRGGEIRANQLELKRDLYYTTDGVEGKTIHIPKNHYFMMGDNTQASEDSRLWKSMTLGIDKTGKICPPGSQAVQTWTGNLRGGSFYVGNPIDPDENPILVTRKHRIVFTDFFGENHVLKGDPEDFGRTLEAAPPQWAPFVPQDFVVGRAFARFWPANPFGVFRLGLIR